MSLRFWYPCLLFPITYSTLPILLPPPPKQCFAGVQQCLLYTGLGIGLRTSGIVGILSTELYLQPYWQFCWQNKNSRLRAPRCLSGLYFWGHSDNFGKHREDFQPWHCARSQVLIRLGVIGRKVLVHRVPPTILGAYSGLKQKGKGAYCLLPVFPLSLDTPSLSVRCSH